MIEVVPIPASARYQTCDACPEYATRIIHTYRPNTGLLISYWCEQHQPTFHREPRTTP